MLSLTALANTIYSMDIPGDPRSREQRHALLEEINPKFPNMEFVGQGMGRFVICLPNVPDGLPLDIPSKETNEIVIKFAYNSEGQQQNRTERRIWEHGSPILNENHLTPVLKTAPNDTWIIMPYRELIKGIAEFEDGISESYDEFPTGDLAAKDSWGVAPDGSFECVDYGRCPIDSLPTH